jgi:hypothetical protein
VLQNADGKQRLPLQALLDSGSDVNIFGTDVAEYLGIEYQKYEAIELQGFGGRIVEGFDVPVRVLTRLLSKCTLSSKWVPESAHSTT